MHEKIGRRAWQRLPPVVRADDAECLLPRHVASLPTTTGTEASLPVIERKLRLKAATTDVMIHGSFDGATLWLLSMKSSPTN